MNKIYVITESCVIAGEVEQDTCPVILLSFGYFTKPSSANKVCRECNKGKKRDENGNKPFVVKELDLSITEYKTIKKD